MNDDRKISIAIPTYERAELTIESFIDVYNDERVLEVVICDDASGDETYEQLKKFAEVLPKIKLFKNYENFDCYKNKKQAISYTNNETDGVILLDSDNVINREYLDRIFEIPEWDADTIYTPSFAYPHFDFRAFEGLLITKENVSEWIDKPMFEVMLNAANYFVHPFKYLEVWDGNVDPVTSDSIFQVYNWLREGKKIQVVKGLQYFHSVHSGSHYQNNVSRTPQGFHEQILHNLKNMK